MTDRQAEVKRAVNEAVSAFNSATYQAQKAGLEVLFDVTEMEHTGRPVLGVTVIRQAEPVDAPEGRP